MYEVYLAEGKNAPEWVEASDDTVTLQELLAALRNTWLEGDTPLCYTIHASHDGSFVAMLFRHASDPLETARTIYFDGLTETHHVEYVLDDAGRYVRSNVRKAS